MATSPPPDAVPAPPGALPPRSASWAEAARRLGTTALGCAFIALLLWLLVPSVGRFGFLAVLVHSELIGLCIAALYLIPRRRLGLERAPPWAVLCANLARSALGTAVGLVAARLALGIPLEGGAWVPGPDELIATAVTALVASAAFAAHFGARARMAELARRAAEEARRADAARLAMLRTQLDPHMLFNTLANLRALISTDAPRAERMVDHLVPFLRATLDGSRADVWSLEREFEELGHYLEIMAVRLGDRLAFALVLPASLREVEVPALLLQPLVENAVRHGIEPSPGGGRIDVAAERSEDELVVSVRDARAPVGAGVRRSTSVVSDPSPEPSFGLENVRQRLRLHGGDRASVTLRETTASGPADAPSGTSVIVRWPIGPDATGGRTP